MRITRLSKLVATAAIGAVALSACGGDADGDTNGGGDSGQVELRFSWWGSDHRVQTTNEIIDMFHEEHPDIRINAEFGDWAGYWDQLATQTAAGDAPDIIQMDDKYLREYADRGALLDLSDVDTSQFDEATIENGTTDAGLVGITTGLNTLVLVANPSLIEEAGLEMPDDTTWTWDDYAEITATVSEETEAFGSADPNEPGGFQIWLRQHGKHLTTEEGELGFEADDVVEYFEYYLQLMEDGGLPPAAVLSEYQNSGPDQSLTGTNRAAFGYWWTNQLAGLAEASGEDLVPLRFPSQSGNAEENGLWYKSAMLLSASARTEHPEEVKTFIDFFVNNVEAASINGTDRGLPANMEVREAVLEDLEGVELDSAEFISSVEDEVSAQPVEPVPAMGFSALQDILYRYEIEVFFERQSPEQAAESMIREMESELN
ncbi:ABC transporter substrate-binding protein [Nesterenkonia rhizosphaerae]|uniref:Extracellular solute-binding protein n=1 Tax=Nesterenkonia rhizosphaerae TaxID=1348272 RepID=A0ABP9FR18_9MICC